MIAYYEPHANGGWVCELYINGEWRRTFRHEGNKESLYFTCEHYAQAQGSQLQALIQGLPEDEIETLARYQARERARSKNSKAQPPLVGVNVHGFPCDTNSPPGPKPS